MALITTPGAIDANSYISVAEATGYFSLSFNRTAWSDAATSDKEKSLAEATRLLDTFVLWNGSIATETQSLGWPRTGVIDPDDRIVADTVVPIAIKNIVCELAYNILKNNGFDVSENVVDKIKVGSINIDFDVSQKSNGFTKIVRDAISFWGTLTMQSSSGVKMAKLVRT